MGHQNKKMVREETKIFEIYAYPNTSDKGNGVWKKYAGANDKKTALDKAEKLFQTCKFYKVQVDERLLLKNNNATKTTTLKTFQREKEDTTSLSVILGVSFATMAWSILASYVFLF